MFEKIYKCIFGKVAIKRALSPNALCITAQSNSLRYQITYLFVPVLIQQRRKQLPTMTSCEETYIDYLTLRARQFVTQYCSYSEHSTTGIQW